MGREWGGKPRSNYPISYIKYIFGSMWVIIREYMFNNIIALIKTILTHHN